MSFSHPRQFAFQRYEYAARDRYHDYYGIVLRENMGGFAAGSRFEAGSIRSDGAIHARSGGRIYFLGRLNDHGSSAQGTDGASFGSDMGADGADQMEQSTGSFVGSSGMASDAQGRWSFSAGSQSGSRKGYREPQVYEARGSQQGRWSFSAGGQSGSSQSGSSGLEMRRGGQQGRWSFSAGGLELRRGYEARGGQRGGRWTFSVGEEGQESSYGSQGAQGAQDDFGSQGAQDDFGSQGAQDAQDDFDSDNAGGMSGGSGMGGGSLYAARRSDSQSRGGRYSCGAMRCGGF